MLSLAQMEKPIYFLWESKYEGSAPAFYELSDFPAASLLEQKLALDT